MRDCAVCGAELRKTLLTIKEPDRFETAVGISAEGYTREWVECEDCTAVTNVQRPEDVAKLESVAANYYEIDFGPTPIAVRYEKILSLPLEKSDNAQRVERISRCIDELSVLRPTSGIPSCLDIGAGTGVFITRFLESERTRGRHWRAIALESDPRAAAHLRSLGLFEVSEALFEGQPELTNLALVTLNKVVEHISQPVEFVRRAGASLSKFGMLYVEVPDSLTIGRRPPSDNILGALHHHLYNPSSLVTLFERAALVPLRIERIFEPSGKISVCGFAVKSSAVEELSRAGSA